MKLEDQVCNLSLAKRLKELEVKQDSYFGWFEDDFIDTHFIECKNNPLIMSCKEVCSAFTVSELGEMLPSSWIHNSSGYFIEIGKDRGIWEIGFTDCENTKNAISIFENSEADARAKLLIYLIENGYVKDGG